MTLTPARPVPDASSAEQQRLEVELLLREPVLSAEQLAQADRSLLDGTGPLTLERARSLTCLPLRLQDGRVDIPVILALPQRPAVDGRMWRARLGRHRAVGQGARGRCDGGGHPAPPLADE